MGYIGRLKKVFSKLDGNLYSLCTLHQCGALTWMDVYTASVWCTYMDGFVHCISVVHLHGSMLLFEGHLNGCI